MTAISDGLLRATPQSRGTDPAAIVAMLDAIGLHGLELHSLLIWQRGALITEAYWHPFGPSRPHMMHSVTKSFTAMAVGLAVDDGLLSVDDPVMGFFPEHRDTNPSANRDAMTVRHLLTMTSGRGTGTSGGAWRKIQTSWVEDFLRQPLPHAPGTVFVYDSAASYMLSAIVQRVTGLLLRDYLTERIFRPMAMSETMSWDQGTDGINTGGNGLCCLSSDLLKLGVLHLQNGQWNGRQLLSADWVRAATGMQVRDVVLGTFTGEHYLGPDDGDGLVPPNKREGYGYQFWRGPKGSYSANGLFGQYCIVLPEQEAVIAFTGGLDDADRRVHDLIYDRLLPALGTGGGSAVDAEALQARLAGLQLATQPGPDTRDIAPSNWQGSYAMSANDQDVVTVDFTLEAAEITVSVTDARGTHSIVSGFGRWVEAVTTMTGARLHHSYEPAEGLRVVACARWLPPSQGWACLEMDWLFVETAFRDTVQCFFKDGAMRLERRANVNSSALSLPELTGRIVSAGTRHGAKG